MSISFVGQNSQVTTAATWPTAIDLTALSLVKDDMVIFVESMTVGSDQTANMKPTDAGYTNISSLYANGSSTYDNSLGVYYKFMGASPDTSVTPTNTGFSPKAALAAVYVYRGVDTVTPLDVAVVTHTVTSAGTSIDASAITPVTPGARVLALAAASINAGTPTLGTIAGYSNQYEVDSYGGTNSVDIFAFADKLWSGSGSEDPPAWTASGSMNNYNAVTIALRPAAGGLVNVPIANVVVAGIVPLQHGLWVFPSDVKSGVVYGPAGEFTGTAAGGGGASRVIGSPVVRRLR